MRTAKWTAMLLALCFAGMAMPPPQAGDAQADPFGALWKRIDGSTATVPLVRAMRTHFQGWEPKVVHNTTARAYERLCNGEEDLIFVTSPSPEDLEIAQQAGVELEVIPVAREALVFLNNTKNPVEGLSLQQLRDIYTGRITNWREVGGEDAVIRPFQREPRSGSQTLFLSCLMAGEEPMAPAKDLTIGDMGQLIDQVSSYNNAPNALGYSVFYYATQMYRNENIRILTVDGVAPSAQSISDGAYPLCTNYYAVLRKDTEPEDPARELVAWLLSAEGQKLAAETGYVPMTGGIFDEEEVDAEGWARTRLSSGTGGTEPRKQTTFVHYPHTLAALPGDVQAMAGAWLEQAAADVGVELNADNIHYSLTVSGELLNLSVIKWGAEDKSSRARCTVIDMERMRELKLSDVFFDGFNYIDYINTHIALMPGDTVVYHYAKEDFEPAEYHRKVNYTGLPKDYPNFAVSLSERGSYLDIVLDSDNPYLRGVGRFPAYIGVQLGHWVSPWGGCTVETTYQEHLLPGGAAFLAPSLCIDDGRVPEAEARINAALADAAERHMRANDVQALHKGYRVESRVTFAGHYAIVSFVVKTDGDPPKTAKVLSYTLADLHTGECFDVLELFDRWRSTSEVAYYDDYAYWVAEGEGEAIQGYQPPENPVLESVRIWEEALVVTIVRGGTSQVDAVFPLSLLEQDR